MPIPMTSFIIAGKNREATEQKAKDLSLEKKIDPFDITLVTSDKDSLGIELVKKLQEKVFLMPLRGKDKAVIIPDAQTLTVPAQNALLKLLEEPPAHTYLYLLTDNQEETLAHAHTEEIAGGNAILLYPDTQDASASSSGSRKYNAHFIREGQWVTETGRRKEIAMGNLQLNNQALKAVILLTPENTRNYADINKTVLLKSASITSPISNSPKALTQEILERV